MRRKLVAALENGKKEVIVRGKWKDVHSFERQDGGDRCQLFHFLSGSLKCLLAFRRVRLLGGPSSSICGIAPITSSLGVAESRAVSAVTEGNATIVG